jgi:hypothetical protein
MVVCIFCAHLYESSPWAAVSLLASKTYITILFVPLLRKEKASTLKAVCLLVICGVACIITAQFWPRSAEEPGAPESESHLKAPSEPGSPVDIGLIRVLQLGLWWEVGEVALHLGLEIFHRIEGRKNVRNQS